MTLSVQNNFAFLRRDILRTFNRADLSRRAAPIMEEHVRQVRYETRYEFPKTDYNVQDDQGRDPGVRHWGSKLDDEQHWPEPSADTYRNDQKGQMGYAIGFSFSHPSLDQGEGFAADNQSVGGIWEWLTEGTPGHIVAGRDDPRNYNVQFYYGPPHKWSGVLKRHGWHGHRAAGWGESTLARGYWVRPGIARPNAVFLRLGNRMEEPIGKIMSDQAYASLESSDFLVNALRSR